MMPVLVAVALVVAQAGAAQAPPPAGGSAFLPDTVLAPPAGPRIVMMGAASGGVAALRLSVPFQEGPAEAGVGHMLRDLAYARVESLARPVGARVSATRTPWGLAYAVEGAVADVEYLAYLLREAVARPDVDGVGLTEARQTLERAVARTLEAPGARTLDLLRRRVAPDLTATQGSRATVAGLDPARVLEAWRRSHQSAGMTLVVSANVAPEVLLAATRGMGAPETTLSGPLDAPDPTSEGGARIQTLRTWYGQAWAGGSPDRPEGPVTALLLAESVGRRTQGFEAGIELWELSDRWALAVVGAAYAPQVRALRATVSGALDDVRSDLTDDTVADAVARVRRDLLMRARTPGGFVGVVGRALESSGAADGAARYLQALEEMGRAEIERFLAELAAASPVQVEIRP